MQCQKVSYTLYEVSYPLAVLFEVPRRTASPRSSQAPSPATPTWASPRSAVRALALAGRYYYVLLN